MEEDNLDVTSSTDGRRLGFLHLLRSVIRQMGFHVLPFVDYFLTVTLGLLGEGYSNAVAEDMEEESKGIDGEGKEDDEMEVDEEGVEEDDGPSRTGGRGRSQTTLRLVSTRTLSDLVTQYAGSFDFSPAAPRLWEILGKFKLQEF